MIKFLLIAILLVLLFGASAVLRGAVTLGFIAVMLAVIWIVLAFVFLIVVSIIPELRAQSPAVIIGASFAVTFIVFAPKYAATVVNGLPKLPGYLASLMMAVINWLPRARTHKSGFVNATC
jgi:hypothetical protein